MRLDDIKRLARNELHEGADSRTSEALARFALLALPVVRAADEYERAADFDGLEYQALINAIATMRRGMGQ